MAKKPKIANLTQNSRIEHRRWCVEMAIRWPSHEENIAGIPGMYGHQIHTQHGGRVRVDQDIIGRAKKIFDWTTEL